MIATKPAKENMWYKGESQQWSEKEKEWPMYFELTGKYYLCLPGPVGRHKTEAAAKWKTKLPFVAESMGLPFPVLPLHTVVFSPQSTVLTKNAPPQYVSWLKKR